MNATPRATTATRDGWDDWHWQCAHRIRTVSDLVEWIGIGPDLERRYADLLEIYPYAVTPYYLSLIDRDDPDDPIRLQCIPDVKELEFGQGESDDPLAEQQHEKVPGLLHRFQDRALVIATHRCAVYCRHCMRKRRWKERHGDRSNEEFMRMVDYIRGHPEIREVIISGGDPLMLSTKRLDGLLASLRAIQHIEVVRLGSRIPVVMPMRIDEELCATLEKYRPLWFVTQFNHPREVTPEAAQACDLLLRRGIPVSNQSVLLRGVNDSLEVMRELCQALQRISVRPYYVFQCDPVRGTGHFRTALSVGVEIATALRTTSSGLCVPTFMVDTPGREGKIPLGTYRLEGELPRTFPRFGV